MYLNNYNNKNIIRQHKVTASVSFLHALVCPAMLCFSLLSLFTLDDAMVLLWEIWSISMYAFFC